MPQDDTNKLKQLFFIKEPQKDRYTSPVQGRSKEFVNKIRERTQHGQFLKTQIVSIENSIPAIKQERKAKGFREDYGVYLEFESEDGFELKFDSLEDIKAGIELENVRTIDTKTYATVYIPDGKLSYFLKKIDSYKNTPLTNKARNKDLIESISNIRLASLRAFWTGVIDFDSIPRAEERWWEVWIRTGNNSIEKSLIESDFNDACLQNSITTKDIRINFPERTVCLIKTSVDVLASSLMILNCLAEIRNLQETAEIFMGMSLPEQRDWAEDLVQRTKYSEGDIPAVCLIDTGVNNGHPLLRIALEDQDMLTFNEAWGSDDQHRHGTCMAGIALYGDLFNKLATTEPIIISHKLESIKLFNERHPHEPELYGAVTRECIYRSEINAPDRNRVHCLAITSEENRFQGRPTSWSAAIDQVSFGELANKDTKRLILIAAGNVDVFQQHYNYPNSNIIESIHDPGQAWNAITIGGYTQKTTIDASVHCSLIPVASNNELAPSSTTSLYWENKWPIKPEIVLEAGNYARDSSANSISDPDSLKLLTTNNKPTERLFTVFGDTSAAVSQASRFAAIIQFQYPDYWPETLRGLLIHSAEWTPEMLSQRKIEDLNNVGKREILRKYGYGVPNLERAKWCTYNFSTLIIQQYITPFLKQSNEIKTNEICFHSLPWPKSVFQALSSESIKLKITLSYFIEPNPTQRKYFGKYDYASHGLRFEIKKGTETIENFKSRMNRNAREENDETHYSGLKWLLGPQVRNIGSIHSDTWVGTATELSEMDTVAIFPVSGWWKFRKRLERWNNSVRYSLIISLESENTEIDIYSPIFNMINIPHEITT